MVGDGVIKLGSWLVVPGTPGSAAIDGHEGTLIADEQDDVAVVGIDPEILVVVATRGAAEGGPGLSAIGGAHADGAGDINQIRIFRINFWNGKIAAADAARRARIGRNLRPVVSCVIGAIDGQLS